MKITTAAFFFCISLRCGAENIRTLLFQKEQEMFEAICTGNKQAAEKLFAPDYITINADGIRQSREETMAGFGKFKGAAYQLSDHELRLYGNTAIMTGKAKFSVKAIPVAVVWYTEIWILHGNDWQFTGWQGTMTGAPSWYPVAFTVVIILMALAVCLFLRRRFRYR